MSGIPPPRTPVAARAMPVAAPSAEELQRLSVELELAADDHLSRLAGAHELQAAVLALILPAGIAQALQAWQAETSGIAGAERIREHVSHLSGAARLPWFETLLSRLHGQPLAARQELLHATRRLMAATGFVRPIDRLHWLAMRQRLSDRPPPDERTGAGVELGQLPQAFVLAIARYTAFLARIIPEDRAASAAPASTESTDPGALWFATVMAPWHGRHATPPFKPTDTEGLVLALQTLQTLTWMQRPTVLRAWVVAALQHSRHGRLSEQAADALRLSGSLLNCPLPPELSRCYRDQEGLRDGHRGPITVPSELS